MATETGVKTVNVAIALPEMPKIGDFKKISDNPDWIAMEYRAACNRWVEACKALSGGRQIVISSL